ncbi:MAG: PAS domain-containing protein [Candidatus Thermoplasmatota archaeon]
MGDRRFRRIYESVRTAPNRLAVIRSLTDDQVVAALAGASVNFDPFIANVLATEAQNRILLARRVLDLLPDAVLLASADGAIKFANSQAGTMFGYEQEELVGVSVEMLMPERFRGAHEHHRHEYQEAPRKRPMGSGLHLLGLRKDGAEFQVDISLGPVKTGDDSLVLMVVREVPVLQRTGADPDART